MSLTTGMDFLPYDEVLELARDAGRPNPEDDAVFIQTFAALIKARLQQDTQPGQAVSQQITLTGHQLQRALLFIAPDDSDQMESEVTIAELKGDNTPHDDNRRMPDGMYAWITEESIFDDDGNWIREEKVETPCNCGLEQTLASSSHAKHPAWKTGNECAPYHPQASHVSPEYRDGWNACYRACQPQAQQSEPVNKGM